MSLTDLMDAIPASAARPEGRHDGLTSRAPAADASCPPSAALRPRPRPGGAGFAGAVVMALPRRWRGAQGRVGREGRRTRPCIASGFLLWLLPCLRCRADRRTSLAGAGAAGTGAAAAR